MPKRTGALCAALLLLASATAEAGVPTLFRYRVEGPGHLVSVAGDWNRWDPSADPLRDPDGDGVFERTIDLEIGRHEYKLVVDGVWMEDPAARGSAPNAYGSSNSVVHVGETPEPDVYRISPPSEESAETELRDVLFAFRPERPPHSLSVVGTFNDWQGDVLQMEGPDSSGLFHARLALPRGEYLYAFLADGVRFIDDRNERRMSDGGGGVGSILVVDDRFPEARLRRGDGRIRGDDLSLAPGRVSVVRTAPGRIVVTARAHRGDVTGASLLIRAGGAETLTPMREAGTDDRFAYFRAERDFPPETEGRLGVLLFDGDSVRVVTRTGLAVTAEDALLLELSPVETPLFALPDWVADGVFYQIFPDRFLNGDPRNDPDFREPYYEGETALPKGGKTDGAYYHLEKDWHDVAGLSKSPYRSDGRPDNCSFYGGDLEGVLRKLPYIEDLGATVLSFTPLHIAKSNDRRDACDWREVDPHLGGSDALRKLVDAAHEAGIRVVVEVVFDYTGSCHRAFRDCVEKGRESPYWLWYEWKKWPLPERFGEAETAADYYACRGGAGALPIINFDLARPNASEAAALRIVDAKPNTAVLDEVRAAIRFWLVDSGVDGIRIGESEEVPPWVWRVVREEVRRVTADVFVVADLPGNAAEVLSPTRFDAAVNHRFFREPCLRFFARGEIDAETFDRSLAGGRFGYPLPAVHGALNVLGTDGTERFLTAAGGDERRLLLGMLFGATYVGAPHIYYGDEIGMPGGADPDCRRPFDWKKLETPQAAAMRDRVRQFLTIRREHPALRSGEYRTLIAEGHVFSFARWTETDRLVVLLNAGSSPATVLLAPEALPFPAGSARDLLAGADLSPIAGAFRVSVDGLSGAVLVFPDAGARN
jgi:glycosidase